MKKSDWAMIVLIIAVVGIACYFIVGAIMPNPVDNPETVETATTVEPKVVKPSDVIFNANAINPAVKTQSKDQINNGFFTNSFSSSNNTEGN